MLRRFSILIKVKQQLKKGVCCAVCGGRRPSCVSSWTWLAGHFRGEVVDLRAVPEVWGRRQDLLTGVAALAGAVLASGRAYGGDDAPRRFETLGCTSRLGQRFDCVVRCDIAGGRLC